MIHERRVAALSGAIGLTITLLLGGLAVYLFVGAVQAGRPLLLATTVLPLAVVTALCAAGLFTVQPNQAVVLILFGSYAGTVRDSGWWWTNPFNTRKRISLRVRSLNGHMIKVNDHAGNPVEIAAVVVWNVLDTAQAVFDVENYEDFVSVQSETAVRHLASIYPYDEYDHDAISLRGSTDKVSDALRAELQERLRPAGVQIVEARLSHLAYAPEIAGAMLQRQQAAAIIAARQRIVEGAVGMVEMALERLSANKIVELDEERKAAMVSNLLVVLCGERAATPVLNTGTLYN
ncbi:MAG TPA: SPFH domain-containing protein [Candidatus Eisenbacteria bacterium]|jgi:regulator of protease activity HflC (stomatin/prohibitin superfamily)|nr:SPFH domain-containing protein [Candidatus Eisenbacteria bacterium]